MSENKIYNIEDIMNFLPHRYPFLLVDLRSEPYFLNRKISYQQ